MYDLSDFGLGEMTLLGAELRKIGAGYHSLEDASQAVARRFVEVVDGQNRTMTDVEIGIVSNGQAEVISGLRQDQVVLVNP